MQGGTGRSGGKGSSSGSIGLERALAALACQDRELRDVRPELRDLERYRGRKLELLLERRVVPRGGGAGVSQRSERIVPRFCVRACERPGAPLDLKSLRGDPGRIRPGVFRAARDHRDQPGRGRDGDCGSRPSARRLLARRDAAEEVLDPQLEVVLSFHEERVYDGLEFRGMPLYLHESDVAALVTPADAVDAVEGSFRRMGQGEIEIAPRRRLQLAGGSLADMAASDLGLGIAGAKVYAASAEGAAFVVCLFNSSELVAVIEANTLGQLRTGAASGVAARHLAKAEARSLGVIGCGYQAETQVECIRAALPGLERVVAYCRTPERLEDFCGRVNAEPAEGHSEAAEQDVVVTITSSRDPVVRGEWLRAGALVIAAGANHPSRRELDNVVLERAAFVCCDWLEQARTESGDLIEPVAAGTLDWLEVHELHEVVTGEVQGRQSDGDVIVFKSNGLASWDVALGAEVVRRASERGVGVQL